jgi:hypothetical protein
MQFRRLYDLFYRNSGQKNRRNHIRIHLVIFTLPQKKHLQPLLPGTIMEHLGFIAMEAWQLGLMPVLL